MTDYTDLLHRANYFVTKVPDDSIDPASALIRDLIKAVYDLEARNGNLHDIKAYDAAAREAKMLPAMSRERFVQECFIRRLGQPGEGWGLTPEQVERGGKIYDMMTQTLEDQI